MMANGTQRLLAFGGIHTAFLLGPLAGCHQQHQVLQGCKVYKWRIPLVSWGSHTASFLLGASWRMCISSARLCRPVLGYCSGWFQRVLDSLDKNRILQCQYSCVGLSHHQWKAYSSSSMWAHPSSPWTVFTQVFSPSFSPLSGNFCSRFLSKWNRIAFLNPNKLLHNLVYLACMLCQKYPVLKI